MAATFRVLLRVQRRRSTTRRCKWHSCASAGTKRTTSITRLMSAF